MTDQSAPVVPAGTYTCACCGGIFPYAWTDDEAHAEAVALWGQRGDTPGMAVVCDDCFQAFMTWHRTQADRR